MKLTIYGAQGIALGAYEAIKDLYPQRLPACFVVTERWNNAEELGGIPVLTLREYSDSLTDEEKNDTEILIATPGNFMPEIEAALEKEGFHRHIRLTSGRWNQLKSYYHAKDKRFMPLAALPVGYHGANMHVYKVCNVADTPISGSNTFPEWMTPIQTGISRTKKRIANLYDNDGENISEKNGNYSELTALYWVWKNRLNRPSGDEDEEYYGLFHYRRIMDLSDDDVHRLIDNDVDVILPFPMPYEPDIGAFRRRYINDREWQALLSALKTLQPAYYESSRAILKQGWLFNYNILMARKNVLKKYCEWLFPILFLTEQINDPDGTLPPNRFIGYVGEILCTIYFMTNADGLNIVHEGVKFLT